MGYPAKGQQRLIPENRTALRMALRLRLMSRQFLGRTDSRSILRVCDPANQR